MSQPDLFAPVPDAVPQPRFRVQKKSRTELVADLFNSRAGEWIDGMELAHVGGQYAWRTRVSECRTVLGMRIDNREVRTASGAVRSEYRFVPSEAQQG